MVAVCAGAACVAESVNEPVLSEGLMAEEYEGAESAQSEDTRTSEIRWEMVRK